MAISADRVDRKRIVRQDIETGEFRNVNPRMTALDIMVLCHTIALHTREVRDLANLNRYIAYQLEVLLAGLNAESAGRKEPASKPRAKSH